MPDVADAILEQETQDALPVESQGAAPDASSPEVSPPPAQSASFDLLKEAAALGLQVPPGADATVVWQMVTQGVQHQQAMIAERERQLAEAQHYAQQYQRIQPKLSDFQKWEQEQARQAQQAREQPPKTLADKFAAAGKWERPDVPERVRNLMQAGAFGRDPQTGRIAVKQEFAGKVSPEDAELAGKLVQWHQQREQLIDNLPQTLAQMIEAANAEYEAKIDAKLQAYQRQVGIGEYEQRNATWLYATDQNGQFIIGQDGKMVPSQYGQIFKQALDFYQRAGVRDQGTLIQLAQREVEPYLRQSQQPAAPTPAPVAPKPQEFRNIVERHARHGSNGSGRPTNRKPASNPRENLESVLDEIFDKALGT